MKTIILYACGIIVLLSSCQKSTTTPQAKILKAYNSGKLYNEWIINDEDAKEQGITKNSDMFLAKYSPTITISKDNTYSFTYTNPYKKTVTETGKWSFDNVDMLTLKGNPFTVYGATKDSTKIMSFDYTFQITTLTEEDLVLDRLNRTSSDSSKGETSSQSTNTKETLYMEDND